jgi:hypothetical protein
MASPTDQKPVAGEPVTSVLAGGDVPFDPNYVFDADEEELAALGYKSEFKREFSLFTTFCVSFAVLGLLPSFASTLFYGMGYAGTAGTLVWEVKTRSVLDSTALGVSVADSSRNDMGMAHCYDRGPMCGVQHG